MKPVNTKESFASSDEGGYVPQFTGTISRQPDKEVILNNNNNNPIPIPISTEKVIPSTFTQPNAPQENLRNSNAQLDLLKKEIVDIKEDYEKKMQKQNQDHQNEKENLKSIHDREIASLKTIFEEKEKLLNQEIERLKRENETQLKIETDKLNELHQNELELKDEKHKKELIEKDNFYKAQIEDVKSHTKQQIELNNLAKKFENSTKQIEDLAAKLEKQKDINAKFNHDNLLEKERKLQQMEENLKETERSILVEKELLLNQKKELEVRETQRKREMQNEKMKIEKEIIRLQQLQSTLKSLEYQSKEKYDKDSLILSYKENEMKMEMDNIQNEYNTKKTELDYQYKKLNEEKQFFEKFKEDAFKNIEVQKMKLDQKKKEMFEEEKKLKERINVLQQKEFYIAEQIDKFVKIEKQLKEKEHTLTIKENDLALAAKRIEDEILALEKREGDLQLELENLERMYQAIENEKIIVNAEKMKIEQDKTDVKLRMKTVDNLRIKYVTNIDTSSNNVINTTPDKNIALDVKELNKTLKEFNSNNSLKVEPLRTNQSQFNSDEYFNNLKSKLSQIKYEPKGSGTGFNSYLLREQEFLKKSNEDLENKLKKTYDIINSRVSQDN